MSGHKILLIFISMIITIAIATLELSFYEFIAMLGLWFIFLALVASAISPWFDKGKEN